MATPRRNLFLENFNFLGITLDPTTMFIEYMETVGGRMEMHSLQCYFVKEIIPADLMKASKVFELSCQQKL